MLMKDEEIAKLKMKSEYDDDADDWVVPQFKLSAKEVSLPTLNGRKGYDMMEQEKENRELAIEGGEGSEEEDNAHYQQKRQGGGGLFSNNRGAGGMRQSQ
jgi:hypothetical protein